MLHRSRGVDAHDPVVRRVVAAGLAQFIRLSTPFRDRLGQVTPPMGVPDGALYPTPHSARFDFAATTSGAAWIDELASRARERLRAIPQGPPAVVHGDWRIENLSLLDGRLTGVFDWDSVHVGQEVIALATAATTFSVDWQEPGDPLFPRPHEISRFVSDYEAARGQTFSVSERDALAASMVASLAYGARCEHADGCPLPEDDCQGALLATLGCPLLDSGIGVLGSSM